MMKKKKLLSQRLKRAFLILIAGIATMSIYSSLTGLPDNDKRQRSDTVTDTDDTRLGQMFRGRASDDDRKNGFIDLPRGRDAFAARAALAQMADKSIDTQYYMWHQDTVPSPGLRTHQGRGSRRASTTAS